MDAFESFFGFGYGLNRRHPEVLCTRCVQSDFEALPAVFHSQRPSWQCSRKAQALFAVGSFEKAIGRFRSEQIRDGFESDGHRPLERRFELQPQLAGDFATTRRWTE